MHAPSVDYTLSLAGLLGALLYVDLTFERVFSVFKI